MPREVRFPTRHELALEMLDERRPAVAARLGRRRRRDGPLLLVPPAVAPTAGERYLLAVPSNTLVRDLVPPDRRRTAATAAARRCRSCAWTSGARPWRKRPGRRSRCADGEKGPLVVQVAWTLVQAKSEGRVSDVAESLVVFREQQADGTWKHDYLLSNGSATTRRWRWLGCSRRSTGSRSACKTAKGEAGLADYQVRTWEGWHHHQVPVVAGDLVPDARKPGGEKIQTPALTVPVLRSADRGAAQPDPESPHPDPETPHRQPPTQTQRGGPALPLAAAQTLASSSL